MDKSVPLSNDAALGKTTCVNLKDPGGTKEGKLFRSWSDCEAIDEVEEHGVKSKTLQTEVSNQKNVETLLLSTEKTTSVLMIAHLLVLASSQILVLASSSLIALALSQNKLLLKVLQETTLLLFPYEETGGVFRKYLN